MTGHEVGKKQTFMINQFANGKIFEQEIRFGKSSLQGYSSSSLTKMDDNRRSSMNKFSGVEAKLHVKIQLLEHETETLEETMWQLNKKIEAID